MRIKALEISSFRGFTRTQRFDLDADAVIISSANGLGKTSLFDAVLWAITGSVPRLTDEDNRLVSMYSESGEMRAALDLRTANGEACRLVRSFDGERQHLRVEIAGQVFRDTRAGSRLLEVLWPEALATPDGVAALTRAITRSVYLQQDLVRQFIEADTDHDRFNAVSELIGAGRVTELQLQLDRAKAAWSRATNIRDKEGEATRRRLVTLEGQLAALSQAVGEPDADVQVVWSAWWDQARQLGVNIKDVPPANSHEAPRSLDAVLKHLEPLRRANNRRLDLAAELLSEMVARSEATLPDEASLLAAIEAAQREVGVVREALTEAENRAAQHRHAQVKLREAREELRALAQLALRHLGDRCPICAQRYDETETRGRLEELATASTEEYGEPSIAEEVARVAAVLEERERALAVAEAKLRRVQETNRQWRAWISDRDRRLQELGIDPNLGPGATEALKALAAELSAATAAFATQQERGEQLALMLAQAAERDRRVELERELASVRREVEELDDFLRSREETGELAAQILDTLRAAALDVVRVRLEHIGPLLQRIYARIDPHPAFRVVNFLTRIWHGRGRLDTEIKDPLFDLSSEWPWVILSSSQMNAFAVAIFLAFNLGVPAPPLSTVILDDPLQSLDDVNLLGLSDLLRRTKELRQLFISTHDVRFGRLLERKLRPVQEDQRTLVIEFDAWTRQGPIVRQRDVPLDAAPLRIVA